MLGFSVRDRVRVSFPSGRGGAADDGTADAGAAGETRSPHTDTPDTGSLHADGANPV